MAGVILDGEFAGFVDQHVVVIGSAKMTNPYRATREETQA